jgi:ATP-dependent Clp protease ATP-binding subunit ClpB
MCIAKSSSTPTMRIDKLTTAFQQALQEASSQANAADHPYIEPAHLLAAMLAQPTARRWPRPRAARWTACRRCRAATARSSPAGTW